MCRCYTVLAAANLLLQGSSAACYRFAFSCPPSTCSGYQKRHTLLRNIGDLCGAAWAPLRIGERSIPQQCQRSLALTPALELLTANYHNLHFAFLDIETRLHGTAAQLGVRSGVEGLLDAIRASHYRVSNYMVYSTIIKGYSINPTLLPVYQQQIANQHCPLH